MATAYVVRNQLGQYLTKKGEWCSGKDASHIYCKPHFDEALNQLFEINTKDIELRGKVVEVDLEDKKPLITEYGPDPQQPELEQSEPVAQTNRTASVA